MLQQRTLNITYQNPPCRFESCPDYFYELLDVRKMLFTKKIKRGYIFSIACTLEKLVLA
jgi:hypothetical protein